MSRRKKTERKRKPTYCCPFLKGYGVEHGKIRCEDRQHKLFESTAEALVYVEQYCANQSGWQSCDIAENLLKLWDANDRVVRDLHAMILRKKIRNNNK